MSIIIFFLQLLLAVIMYPLHFLQYAGLLHLIIRTWFPYFMTKFSNAYNKVMDEEKKKLFSTLSDFAGSSKELRLLEIGCGTGTNFKYYPSGSKVTCLDINPNFEKYLSKSLAENSHITYENFFVASADCMTTVADASMDVVVCTLVACSLKNTLDVLKEAKRVLRPGGAFYFIEPVASSDDSSWLSFFQSVINPTWGLFLDGCSVRKTTWRDLDDAEFSEIHLNRIHASTYLAVLNPHIIGYAVK
ncbi:thiol S-methyltransferase TMT1A-like [Gastrophryne carolinensis]